MIHMCALGQGHTGTKKARKECHQLPSSRRCQQRLCIAINIAFVNETLRSIPRPKAVHGTPSICMHSLLGGKVEAKASIAGGTDQEMRLGHIANISEVHDVRAAANDVLHFAKTGLIDNGGHEKLVPRPKDATGAQCHCRQPPLPIS